MPPSVLNVFSWLKALYVVPAVDILKASFKKSFNFWSVVSLSKAFMLRYLL